MRILVDNITVGSDPELFIINTKTGKVVSSVGLIPGEKGNPYVADDMPDGFGLETDNILAEFNIPPVRSRLDFINSINYMKRYIDAFVKKINPDYGIKCSAYEVVDADQLQSDQAKLFGCMPDYNVYTESENPAPKGTQTNGRSSGFHIHLGYARNNVDTSLKMIRYMDMFLGLPSILYDKDTRRRSLYGKAGAFRLTPYGLEYRCLSSAMYANDELMGLVWDQLMNAIDACNTGAPLADSGLVVKAINNSDEQLARTLIKKYLIM
jgi:hypothetical protein